MPACHRTSSTSMILRAWQETAGNCPDDIQCGAYLLLKFDLEGKPVHRAFRPARERIQVFLQRIHTGGIAKNPDGDGFYFIYPDEFAIFHFDGDLDLEKVIRSPFASHWRPRMPDLPASLSPYEFDPPHKEWWDSHLHIEKIFSLGESLLLVTLYETRGYKDQARYLNVYTTSGLLIAEGIVIPHPLRIVGTAPGAVYVATQPYLDAEGILHPATLQHYSMVEASFAAAELPSSPLILTDTIAFPIRCVGSAWDRCDRPEAPANTRPARR